MLYFSFYIFTEITPIRPLSFLLCSLLCSARHRRFSSVSCRHRCSSLRILSFEARLRRSCKSQSTHLRLKDRPSQTKDWSNDCKEQDNRTQLYWQHQQVSRYAHVLMALSIFFKKKIKIKILILNNSINHIQSFALKFVELQLALCEMADDRHQVRFMLRFFSIGFFV